MTELNENAINEAKVDMAAALDNFNKNKNKYTRDFNPWLESTVVHFKSRHYCAYCGEPATSLQAALILARDHTFSNVSDQERKMAYDTTGYRCGICEESVKDMAKFFAFTLFKNLHSREKCLIEPHELKSIDLSVLLKIQQREFSRSSPDVDTVCGSTEINFNFTIKDPSEEWLELYKNDWDFKQGMYSVRDRRYYSENPIHNFYLLVAKEFIKIRSKQALELMSRIKAFDELLNKTRSIEIPKLCSLY
ncbi:hypothetical protein [Photobacterium kishitanii]|uniref:Uncharacterized protein n=1 Tax=Photobacterium kishitanii TaxID=318456 RepID=A0A2T3KL29_9GAMM|nr:hypothetical protein [Photobacterium kishitanii]PSV00425.1 hypothetical protein C9J27_04655 [Photobacterium kishitanii]